jgi:hypothetical protein
MTLIWLTVVKRKKDILPTVFQRSLSWLYSKAPKKHLSRYLNEIGFRWNQREPELKVTNKGELKIVMIRLPPLSMLKSLLMHAPGRQVRRSANGGIFCLMTA